MTPPNSELQQRIRRIEYGLEQVGSLLVPIEISDGVKKAITLCNIDPEMALGRARKVLDFILADLYKREFARPAGTQPLENLIQQLAKAGKLPRTMVAYANSVRELGNVGIHGSGEAITQDDVVSSLENLMRLVAWYCEQVRPTADEKSAAVVPPEDSKLAHSEAHPAGDAATSGTTSADTVIPPAPPPPPKPVDQAPPSLAPKDVPAAPEPAKREDDDDANATGPSLDELRAESFNEKARALPLTGGTAIPFLDQAIQAYTELLAKADHVWSHDAMYKFTGLDKPLKLSKEQWIDELQYKLADTYATRGMAKVYADKYGAAAAKPDFDYAISVLEKMEAAKMSPDPLLLDVGFLINIRGTLLQSYFFRTNSPNELPAQLHDASEYIRRWEMSFNNTPMEELLTTGRLNWLCLILQRRAYINSELGNYPAAVADAERVVSIMEAARQARPTDATVAKELSTARQFLAGTKSKAAIGKFTGWFKKK